MPYSGRQEVFMRGSSNAWGKKNTHTHTKCKLTHNPALGDFIVQLAKDQKGKCLL